MDDQNGLGRGEFLDIERRRPAFEPEAHRLRFRILARVDGLSGKERAMNIGIHPTGIRGAVFRRLLHKASDEEAQHEFPEKKRIDGPANA